MLDSQREEESGQRPEEGPAGQVSDDEGAGREPARESESGRGGQGESRGDEMDDETAQTGNPPNAG
jgi:hypothetical protein